MRFFFLSFSILVAVITVGAQEAGGRETKLSNFSGKWVIVSSKSTVRFPSVEDLKENKLEITVDGDVVTIKEISSFNGNRFDRVYGLHSDGRGETNLKTKSKTKFSQGRVVRKWNYKENYGWVDASVTYSLSKDGKTLLVEVSHYTGNTNSTFNVAERRVYRREE